MCDIGWSFFQHQSLDGWLRKTRYVYIRIRHNTISSYRRFLGDDEPGIPALSFRLQCTMEPRQELRKVAIFLTAPSQYLSCIGKSCPAPSIVSSCACGIRLLISSASAYATRRSRVPCPQQFVSASRRSSNRGLHIRGQSKPPSASHSPPCYAQFCQTPRVDHG